MGGTVRKLTGEDEKKRMEEFGRKVEAERVKAKNESEQKSRMAGEAAASSVRARRRRGGLLETASVVGGEQTLGSGAGL
jgi:hypothetical protein